MPSPWNKGNDSTDPSSNAQDIEQIQATLWGKRGDNNSTGLVGTIATLAVTVTQLADSVRKQSEDIVVLVKDKIDVAKDENGDEISLKEMNKKLNRLETLLTRALWGLAGIGAMAVLLLGRAAFTLIHAGAAF